MKILIGLIMATLTIASATTHAAGLKDLTLICESSDKATILIDNYEDRSCRVRRFFDGQISNAEGLGACYVPYNKVDSFTFWGAIAGHGGAEFKGELKPAQTSYEGWLRYSVGSTYFDVTVTCKAYQ